MHTANIVVHVLFGSMALLIGCAQLVRRKGGQRHRSHGRRFVMAMVVVVGTAALGLAVFRFGAFLAVITALAAYWTYSGWRALRIAETGPQLSDTVAPLIGLAGTAAFLFYLPAIRFPWAGAVIYSTLATHARAYPLLKPPVAGLI